ncbi:hypothetical protein [Spirosoma validum]|uniref:Uncharacterized protein n=1 Tax=Spirosoma validum TaxID=2771355 RepID=A0A927GD00_9BACT|nr:hypothetical protein [Spirosoma validum]MBD2753158.1 hypothetical protein [Spirosoma validum]
MTALSTDASIRRIARLQDKTGLFPSVRSNSMIGYRRADTNVFFTASTVFTLKNLQPDVSSESQALIDAIQQRAVKAYPIFQNKDGLNTYNFWPTRPSRHFSNGYIFHRFEHFRIPDDIDDTAMVYLTTEPSRTDQLWLKDKLAQHANGSQPQRIRNTYDEYRQLQAYSTWFGKNMGVDFDACALSNMLYCIYQYNLPRNQHDTDSLTYLRSIVESRRYVTEPFRCAPHYARTSLIIYHLTRLMAAFAIPELEPLRPQLIRDTYQELAKVKNRVEQMILATSLIRLGEAVATSVNTEGIERDISTFNFFIAGLLTAYEQPLLRRFADRSIVQMRWHCEAHSWALIAEYTSLMAYK